MWLLVSLAFLLCFSAYFYYSFVYLTHKKMKWYRDTLQGLGYKVRQMPTNPFGAGLYGEWQVYSKTKGDSHWTMKNQIPYYDVSLYNILNKPVIDFVNPSLIKEFFSPQKVDLYPKVPFLTANIRRVLGEGTAFSEGNQWRRKRKIITSVFNFQFLKRCVPKMAKICITQMKLYQTQHVQDNEKQQTRIKVYLLQMFSSIFSNILIQCFFGDGLDNQRVEGQRFSTMLYKILGDLGKQGASPIGLIFGAKIFNLGLTRKDKQINHKVKIFRSTAKQFVQKRVQYLQSQQNKEGYNDIIEALMYNKMISQKSKQNGSYDFNQLIDEFCTFYTAGTDTTSHMIMVLVYYLACNPDCEKKLRNEISDFIKSDQDINYQTLKKMRYLQWAQNEVTRMYGPGIGIFYRDAQKDHYVKNIPIKKGSYLTFSPMANHYNPKFYPDPFTFKPERWQKQTAELDPFTFVGFSAGPRHCIGKQLAYLEGKVALIKFLQRYSRISIPFKNIEDIKFIHSFLYEPEIFDTELELKNDS